ncbi:PepSY-associated TM helix domain-containing protein [Catenovulum agarivorans]|uniref:PepSY-associated TM helix domain-containing protein n=1 Tax=Catenovulum agarivorans TaxID=1172192 RepID=UPI00030CBF2C|nr:PepSY-associated TM helix domain-containing protein [Catenovulum agarivorans]
MAKLSNRFWFQLHGWFSLPIWMVFCFVCLTGTIAVVSHEITWLVNPNARAVNSQQLPAKPIEQLIAAVEKAHPTADVTNVMRFEPYLATAVTFTDTDKPYAIAYVNQYTGEIQEVNNGVTFVGFMRSLHGWLLFPWQHSYSLGYYLVCIMAILMLGALITGLVVYKKFWKGFFKFNLRTNQGKRTLFNDLHRLSGVWSIWFMLVMSLTGLWYLVQAICWHAEIEIEPHAPMIPVAQLPSNLNEQPQVSYSLSDSISIARQLYPDFNPSYIHLPEHNRDTYHLSGAGDFIFFDQYSYKLNVNPWTGAVEYKNDPSSMTLMQTLSHIADPLHYGTIGGLVTKFIWFVFGIILTGMSITGFCMWFLRTNKAQKRVEQVAEQVVGESA